MYKLEIFLIVLAITVLSLENVNAQEPKLATFQETAQLLIDQTISNNVTASITHQTTSNQEIRIPTEIINKIHDTEEVLAVVLTNDEQCVLGVFDDTCVMINISREGIDGGIIGIQDKAREIGDSLIDEINQAFDIETSFHSVYIHHRDESNVILDTSGVVSGRNTTSAVYTMPKEDTESLYQKLSTILLPKIIRDGGGFYNTAENLAAESNSQMTISIIPVQDQTLLQLKVSVDYPDVDMSINEVNPLKFLKTDELRRSNYFSSDFYPLNSLLRVVILSNEPIKVDKVNTNMVPPVMRDGERLPDFTTDGWFFDSESGNKIEATYLFGKKFNVNEDELVFTVTSFDQTPQDNNVIDIDVPSVGVDNTQIIILGGIIAAAIGASIYYLKGFRAKKLN